MEVGGLCSKCGKAAKTMKTCRLCGAMVCGNCFDESTGTCRSCSRGKRI